uniref:major prion protein homolog n=1 Tax=Monopterus albus TaxID=43700 RepID=UPI0009B4B8A9|nr:major prion protein homolog [Monopterus albus]
MLKIALVLGCLLSLVLANPINMMPKRVARSNSGSSERRPGYDPSRQYPYPYPPQYQYPPQYPNFSPYPNPPQYPNFSPYPNPPLYPNFPLFPSLF